MAETDIGAEAVTATMVADDWFCLSFDIEQTHFKRGDILRLKFKSAVGLFYFPEPQRAEVLTLTIPFKIDL